MRGEKRRWLYSGITVPRGIALVRRPVRRVATAATRVLLIGGPVAQHIAPALGRIAREARVDFLLDARPAATTLDWHSRGWLANHLATFSPAVVLIGLDPTLPGMRRVEASVRGIGATPLWLPSGPAALRNSLPATTLHLPVGKDRMTPTAAGYAAWAEAVWRAIN